MRTKTNRTPGPVDAALGLKIRSRRDALRLSQKSLANKIGVTMQQVHNYEHGLTKMSIGRLVEIAQALDCRVIEFVGELDKVEGRHANPIALHLGLAGAPQLLRAYSRVPNALRRTTLKLLVAIAEDQEDQRRQDDSGAAARTKLRLDKHVPG